MKDTPLILLTWVLIGFTITIQASSLTDNQKYLTGFLIMLLAFIIMMVAWYIEKRERLGGN